MKNKTYIAIEWDKETKSFRIRYKPTPLAWDPKDVDCVIEQATAILLGWADPVKLK